jgi:hypothetical protein
VDPAFFGDAFVIFLPRQPSMTIPWDPIMACSGLACRARAMSR